MTDLLFDNNWPIVIALVSLSAVLRITGKRQQQKPLVIGAWVALALGLGVFALGHYVNTDREVLNARTEALVVATSPVDRSALGGFFAPSASLTGPDGDHWDTLTAAFVADELESHDVKENDVRAVETQVTAPGQAVTLLEVASKVSGYPVRTGWRVQWHKGEDGRWLIQSMQWTTVSNRKPHPGLYR